MITSVPKKGQFYDIRDGSLFIEVVNIGDVTNEGKVTIELNLFYKTDNTLVEQGIYTIKLNSIQHWREYVLRTA